MNDLPSPTASRRDVAADAQEMWDVLADGGIVICPGSVGYAMAASSTEAAERMNRAKGRGAHKRLGLMMGDRGERQVHHLDPSKRKIIDCATQDYNLPLVVIARYRTDHPLIEQLDEELLKLCTANGTVSAGVNMGGWFLNAINQRDPQTLPPILASSANRSGCASRQASRRLSQRSSRRPISSLTTDQFDITAKSRRRRSTLKRWSWSAGACALTALHGCCDDTSALSCPLTPGVRSPLVVT